MCFTTDPEAEIIWATALFLLMIEMPGPFDPAHILEVDKLLGNKISRQNPPFSSYASPSPESEIYMMIKTEIFYFAKQMGQTCPLTLPL